MLLLRGRGQPPKRSVDSGVDGLSEIIRIKVQLIDHLAHPGSPHHGEGLTIGEAD